MNTNKWNIDPLNTFRQWIIIEAEDQGSIKEVSKKENTTTGELEGTVTPINRRVFNNNSFYNKVWGNIFVEFEPAYPTVDHTVVFNVRNVLSNIGYDIYLVTAPALANDSNATEAQRMPTKMRASINYHDVSGAEKEDVLQQTITTTADVMDYILLAEDYKFPVATYGLNEAEPQVTLTIKTKVTATEMRTKKFGRTMRIDCIMLVPHGISHVDDERFEISPHADGETFYWLRQ